jgi:hypothetical protein
MSDGTAAEFGTGFLMLLLRLQISFIGVLHCLPGAFMSGQVTVLSVFGAATLGVGSQLVVFSRYLL